MHPAISSKIMLAKEKERKNRKIEEKEIVFVFFFEEKKAMATLLLDYFEKKCLAEEVYLQFGGKVFKKSG